MSKTNRMYLVTGAAGFLGSTVCRKLVYCSSTGAIPEEEKGSIRECEGSIPLDPERIKGCYSLSKAMATNVVLKAAKEGLNI